MIQNIQNNNMQTHSNIGLIAMDFDLTIYDHANPKHTLQLMEWFKYLDEKNIKIGLASGRTVSELRSPLDEISLPWGLPFPHFVICNEGEIRTPDDNDWPGAEKWNKKRTGIVLNANEILYPYFQELVKWGTDAGFTVIREIIMDSCGINVVFETPAIAEMARDRLTRQIPGRDDITISRNHHIVLALPKIATKGAALTELAKIEGLKHQQVMTIGDNLNDLPMLSPSMGFCTATIANADDVVKQYVEKGGGFIAKSKISNGVAEIFHHFFGPLPEKVHT